MNSEKLFEDVVKEGGKGDEDGGGGEPEGGHRTDTGVLGLDLVGLYVDDVVLLEIVVGGVDEFGIVEVDGMDLLLSLGIFADEFDTLTDAIDAEVAGLGEGLEDVNLLVADGEHTGTVDFAEDRDLVVGHADRDHRVLCGIEVGLYLVVDHLFTLGLGEASDLDGSKNREIDTAVVVDQIGLQ